MKRSSVILMIMMLAAQFLMAQAKSDRPKVMIIPFDPDMYFCDADQDLAKYNQKNIREVRTLFRYGLNTEVNAKILSEYETKPLLTDTAKDAAKDLYSIYKGISYFEDKSMPNPSDPPKKEEKKGLFGNSGEKPNEQTTSRLTKIDKDGLRNYINVRIYNVKMLEYLHDKYGTELFLFLNQFNMVTDFAHCLDRATNTFERELAVHYSVFDYHGKQLAGDVAIVKFPSNSNDITTIIRSNFPIISNYLAGTMPGHVKLAADPKDANSASKDK